MLGGPTSTFDGWICSGVSHGSGPTLNNQYVPSRNQYRQQDAGNEPVPDDVHDGRTEGDGEGGEEHGLQQLRHGVVGVLGAARLLAQLQATDDPQPDSGTEDEERHHRHQGEATSNRASARWPASSGASSATGVPSRANEDTLASETPRSRGATAVARPS